MYSKLLCISILLTNLSPLNNVSILQTLSNFFLTAASWVFAIEYLEVVLKGALIMKNDVIDLVRKEKQNKSIQYCLTTLFSFLLTAWLIWSLVLAIWKKKQNSVVYELFNLLTIF